MARTWLLGFIFISLSAFSITALEIQVNPNAVAPGQNINIIWNATLVTDPAAQVVLTVTPELANISLVTLNLQGTTNATTRVHIPLEATSGTYTLVNKASLPTPGIFSVILTTPGSSSTPLSGVLDASSLSASTIPTAPINFSSPTLTPTTSAASNPTKPPNVSDSASAQNVSTSTAAPQSRMSLPKGTIAGIAVGTLAFCVILIGLLFCVYTRYNRTYKKRSESPLEHTAHTHSSSVDPFLVEKLSGMSSLERRGMFNEAGRTETPREYPDSTRDNLHSYKMDVAGSTISAGSESVLSEYPILRVNNPYSKYLGKDKEKLDSDEDSYGSLTSQQVEELNEKRKKMRELIEVMKERRNSASSGIIVGGLESGPPGHVRG